MQDINSFTSVFNSKHTYWLNAGLTHNQCRFFLASLEIIRNEDFLLFYSWSTATFRIISRHCLKLCKMPLPQVVLQQTINIEILLGWKTIPDIFLNSKHDTLATLIAERILLCKAKRQYLLTCKVSRYCHLALHDSIAGLCLENQLNIFQSQKAVSAHFTSNQILPFGCTRR